MSKTSNALSSKLKSLLVKNFSELKKQNKSQNQSVLNKIPFIPYLYLMNQYGPYCEYKYRYSYQVIDNLVYNRNTHLTTRFKDNMITDFIDEFLKRFYKKKESFNKIPQFASFYINYQKYFCIPTFRVKFYNKKIHYQREKKAKCFYNEKFKDKESHNTSSQNEVGVCPNSMGGKPKGKLYIKSKKDKKNKTFFNEEVKELLEKETLSITSNINSNNTITLNESGSKLKSNSSYLLNTTSKEESLCNIMNGLYNKKLFEVSSNIIDTKRTNKTLSQKNKNINIINMNNNNNKNILNKKNNANNANNNIKINNNIKLVLKKRVINIKNKYKSKNISISNNYETSEYNTKKVDNLSTNAVNKFGIQNLKIFLNNKEYEKSANNKKFGKRAGLWNAINEKEKENRHVKSQDNVIKGANNLLTFHKNKKVTRNISYVTLYNKKKSLPNSKSNISAKIKNNEFDRDKNNIHNLLKNHNINDFTKNSNYSKDKIRNMKKKSYKPIRLSKSNININPNDSLLNRIKNKVYDILQKKAHSREKLPLKNKGENLEKYHNNLNYNSVKRTPNGLTIFYPNLNSNKENNYMSNNHRRNNNKFDLKSSSNIFKSNKLSKSPSISEFVRYIRIQKNIPINNKKNFQRNYQTIEGKSNNIQNLNININNQINIRLNNINELPSESLNNKKYLNQPKLVSRNKNKSIDYNTNQNFVIKYNNNLPTFFANDNNPKKKKFRIFQNKHSLENNQRGNRNNNKFTYFKEKKIK